MADNDNKVKIHEVFEDRFGGFCPAVAIGKINELYSAVGIGFEQVFPLGRAKVTKLNGEFRQLNPAVNPKTEYNDLQIDNFEEANIPSELNDLAFVISSTMNFLKETFQEVNEGDDSEVLWNILTQHALYGMENVRDITGSREFAEGLNDNQLKKLGGLGLMQNLLSGMCASGQTSWHRTFSRVYDPIFEDARKDFEILAVSESAIPNLRACGAKSLVYGPIDTEDENDVIPGYHVQHDHGQEGRVVPEPGQLREGRSRQLTLRAKPRKKKSRSRSRSPQCSASDYNSSFIEISHECRNQVPSRYRLPKFSGVVNMNPHVYCTKEDYLHKFLESHRADISFYDEATNSAILLIEVTSIARYSDNCRLYVEEEAMTELFWSCMSSLQENQALIHGLCILPHGMKLLKLKIEDNVWKTYASPVFPYTDRKAILNVLNYIAKLTYLGH